MLTDKTIIIYTFIDDLLKVLGHKGDKRQKMNDAEVITTILISSMFFSSNIERTRLVMLDTGLIPDMLSKSRLSRRINKLMDLINQIFFFLGSMIKEQNKTKEYLLDAFPVGICHNIRIMRSKLIKGKEYRGKCVAKREYFYGVKVHVLTTSDCIPVEFTIVPGSYHDTRALTALPMALPERSSVFMDAGYTDYFVEDTVKEQDNIELFVQRKKNSNRPHEPFLRDYISFARKNIESCFSSLTSWFPRRIHCTTFNGFIAKIICFITAFTINAFFFDN